jgi:hypothetical protein
MYSIKTKVPTFIKKFPQDSTSLAPKDKQAMDSGTECKIDNFTVDGNHALIYYEKTSGYVYRAHWVGLEDKAIFFSSGVLKPIISENASRTAIVEEIVRYCIRVGVKNLSSIAYILATAQGEAEFRPVKEYRGKQLTPDQQKYWDTNYMGRGLIQVTWKSNYVKVGKGLGIDLVNQPDLLLTLPCAIASLVLGMQLGWYTGKKLADYSPKSYWNMREIVNPGEIKFCRYFARAQKFVDFAIKWEGYLQKYQHLYPGIGQSSK